MKRDRNLESAIAEAREALAQADMEADSQLRALGALEKVVEAYEAADVEPAAYAQVRQSVEERRQKLVETAERSLEVLEESDGDAEVQAVLAGSRQIFDRLAPEQADRVSERAESLGQKPFFSRFLQKQAEPDRPITLKFPSDKEDSPHDRRCLELVTRKFPSDWEDQTERERPDWVTLKYPSDDDELFTLKYPSDCDEPAYK